MNPYSKASDLYLTQRVTGASPEQLAVILLEGAQRFLTLAALAITRKDYPAKAHALNKALAIIEELVLGLDFKNGGELAQNLLGLYNWWGREIMDAGSKLEPARLERVSRQMADLRQTLEQAPRERTGPSGSTAFQAGNLVG